MCRRCILVCVSWLVHFDASFVEPEVAEGFCHASAVVALEFYRPVFEGSSAGELFFEGFDQVVDINFVFVDTIDQRVFFPEFLPGDADGDVLVFFLDVIEDTEFLWKSRNGINII